MTLENLLKIGQLKSHVTDATEIRRLLDAARRNLSDYMGEDVDEVSAENCIREAEQLLREVEAWLKKNHPNLVRK